MNSSGAKLQDCLGDRDLECSGKVRQIDKICRAITFAAESGARCNSATNGLDSFHFEY